MIEQLYQSSPRRGKKTHPASFTLSRASYDKAAKHEAVALLLNGKVPNYDIRLNYTVTMPARQIAALWRKHSRRLERAGIIARVAIEITKDKWRQRPTKKIHYHFVVQDTRTPKELRRIIRLVCQCEMPKGSFRVTCKPIDNWFNRVWYFVKYRMLSNYLFRPKLGLQKFYTIGSWWVNKDGTERTRESIEEEIRRYAIAKKHLKMSERLFEINKHKPVVKEKPTNCAKLIAVLEQETEETLYDWLAVLLGKPAVFGTVPPPWLLDHIHSSPQKRYDLFTALCIVLQETDDPLIALAFETYMGYKVGE